MNFVAEALGLSRQAAEKLEEGSILRKAFVRDSFFPDLIDAYRLDKKFGKFEEGTFIAKLKDRTFVARGFPKIRRTLLLYPTLKKHFGNRRIVLEEKMNGYNVRIVKMGENIYAITRGGLLCPYTTEKARKMISTDFFEDFPEYMLCCEAVGIASPYVVFDYGVEFDFFLFDIRNAKTNEALSVKDKVEIAESYSIKTARILLETNADNVEPIFKTLQKLEAERREGVVIKDVEMKIEPLKYTTSYINCSDLRYAFRYFAEYGRDFMLSRIIREAFQSYEIKETQEDFEKRCLRLGKAILEPLIESIKDVKSGKDVVEKSKIFFYDEKVVELFKRHLKMQGINAKLTYLYKKDGKIYYELQRVMRSTTDRISRILEEGYWQ